MTVYLYVFVRNDMDSMNPGKAAAQACHAANQMVYDINKSKNKEHNALLKEWEAQTKKGFGTTLVFSGVMYSIQNVVGYAKANNKPANTIWDPTYPVRDGYVTHQINILTAGYVLCDSDYKIFNKQNEMDLMP